MKVWVHKTPDTIEIQISSSLSGYQPDVLQDLVNRALELMGAGYEYVPTDPEVEGA